MISAIRYRLRWWRWFYRDRPDWRALLRAGCSWDGLQVIYRRWFDRMPLRGKDS